MFKKFFNIESFKSWTVNAIRNTRNLIGGIGIGALGGCALSGVLAFFGIPVNLSVYLGKALFKVYTTVSVGCFFIGLILGREVS